MFDEVMDSINSSGYDVEAYKQKKKEQKEKAYKLIDEALEELKTSHEAFEQYLSVQSNFDAYTPRNALLIAKQNPAATQVKEWNKWKETGVTFNSKYPKKILLLDPKEPITTPDGKKITRIYAKEVIDVSETNTRIATRSYDKEFVLKALLSKSPVPFKKSDIEANGKICEWNQTDKIIYVWDNDNPDLLIQSVATEIAKVHLLDDYGEIDEDKAVCVSYMVCKKYGIEPQMNVTDKMVEKYSKMDTKDIAEDLTSFKNVLSDMNNDIDRYLEEKSKSSKTKEQER